MNDKLIHKELAFAVVGAAMEVHKTLGRGFLESVYHTALAHELKLRNIDFKHHMQLPIQYKGVDAGIFEADFVVDGKVILELKAVAQIAQAHRAQALHYLAATGMQLALIINFGAPSLEYERIVFTKRATNSR